MQDRNVYILYSEDVCLDFILHNVDLQLLLFSVYIPDCICVENNPVNVLSSVNVGKMILRGAENFFENESNLQSFKGSHSLLSIFCCNYMQYFGSTIVEGVAESWVETEMSWLELG